MKMLFKQRMFSWFDSYDVYNESGTTLYTVKGQLSWGHCLKIFDSSGVEVGTVKQKIFTFLPAFEIYVGDKYLGSIKREFTFFKPVYNIDFNGWHVEGNLFEWDYSIVDRNGKSVAAVSKELFNWTDTYTIDVLNPEEAVYALMLVIAIDAEKCSRDD
ncbi:MAG: LURP-one-related family protein [Clostridia bacterium]|nr:LURP-one-related family protein [Clostridia bacterium]